MAPHHTTGSRLGDRPPRALRSKEDGEPDRRPRMGHRRALGGAGRARLRRGALPLVPRPPHHARAARRVPDGDRPHHDQGHAGGGLRPRRAQHLPQATEGARPHRGGPGAAGHPDGRLRGGGGRPGGALGTTWGSTGSARPVRALGSSSSRSSCCSAGCASSRSSGPAGAPTSGTSREPPARAGDRAAHAWRPAALLFRWAVAPEAAGRGGRRSRCVLQFVEIARRRRPRPVQGAPRLPPGARGCGASTPSTTRPRPWTGWPARACTWSTSWSHAGCRSCRSTCSASRRPRSTPTWCSCPSRRCSSTPTCASASGRSSGWSRRRSITTGTTPSSPAVDKNFAVHLPMLDRLFGT